MYTSVLYCSQEAAERFCAYIGDNNNDAQLIFEFMQPVLTSGETYMTLVKNDGKYYIVNNDATLTEVIYDERSHMLYRIHSQNTVGIKQVAFSEKKFWGRLMLIPENFWGRQFDY